MWLLASWNYVRLAMVFKPVLRIDAIADTVAFLLIAVLVMVMANVAGILFKNVLSLDGAGLHGHLGGAIAGLMQGVLLVTVCLLVTVAFFPQTEWLTEAKLPQLFFRSLSSEHAHEPGRTSGRVQARHEDAGHEMPQWMHEKSGGS